MWSPFSKEISIRLAEDDAAFVCTTKYGGGLLSRAATFLVERECAQDTETQVRRTAKWPRSLLGLSEH